MIKVKAKYAVNGSRVKQFTAIINYDDITESNYLSIMQVLSDLIQDKFKTGSSPCIFQFEGIIFVMII
jgi:hypothetical protein